MDQQRSGETDQPLVNRYFLAINGNRRFGSEDQIRVLPLLGFSGDVDVTVNGLKDMQHVVEKVSRI